jgi:polysaccharide export outer membrane protein
MTMMKVSKLLGRWGVGCGLILAGLFFAGCQSGSPKRDFAEVPGLTAAPASVPANTAATAVSETNSDPNVYLLQPQDALRITFADLPTPQLPFEDRIKEDGTVTLLLNQTFQAAGKTRAALEKEIRDRYVPRYFVNMTVSVIHQDQTRFYYVDGEVKLPNRQVYISRITVLKAIASAGGFTDFAWKTKVQLTRADGRKTTINSNKALANSKLDLEVYPGDKIWVPRRWF